MKISSIKLLSLVLATGGCLLANSSLHAQPVYTVGHGDFGIEYTPGETEFEPHWHLHEGAVVDGQPLAEEEEYAPADLIAQTSATAPTIAGSATWLGVPTGTTVYRLGSHDYEPEVGFGTEELTDTDWLDSSITISLSGWSLANPGEIALLSGTGPSAVVYASTFDPNASQSGDNTWSIDLGVGHSHPVWYLSAAGVYEVEFTWSGTYIGDGGSTPVTGTGTFTIQAVPEPGIWALLVLGIGTILIFRHRSRKQA